MNIPIFVAIIGTTTTMTMMMMMMSCEAILAAPPKSPKEVEEWVQNLTADNIPEKVTRLHFYFHRTATSGVLVAQPADRLPNGFGVTIVKDDPLTRGLDLSSDHIGYAQGIAPTTSLEQVSIFETYALVFTHPPAYNGSTLSVSGSNPLLQEYREVAIVGGTGSFRLARGIATYKTVFYNATANLATVEVNLVVFHF